MTISNTGIQPNQNLTAKQAVFCHLYCSAEINMNGSEAARRAGYKGNDNTLRVVASENLAKPNVRKEIDRRLGLALSSANVTVEKVLNDIEMTRTLALLSGQLAVVLRCSELQGKYLGMFTGRSYNATVLEDTNMDKLVQLANRLAKKIPGLFG